MNEKVFGPVNLARIYLVIGAGLPVCTGVVIFALGFTGYELLAKQPFAPRSDLIATWAFAVPAAVVLFLCRRVYHRFAGGDPTAPARLVPLVKLVPALILVGVVGGAWMTQRIISGAEDMRRMTERSMCDDVFSFREGSRDWAPPPADGDPRLAACLPDARLCSQERPKAAVKSGGWNLHLDSDQRPEIICLRKAGHAAGWLR